MHRHSKLGLAALVVAAATIWLLPAMSLGKGLDPDGIDRSLKDSTQKLGAAVSQTLAPVDQALRETKKRTKAGLDKSSDKRANKRVTSPNPAIQPPLHGTNPHGQGSVAVVDSDPSAERPQGGDPAGADSGEEVVVGRARGEQQADGSYRGHITILGLFGTEVAGVNTTPGQTANGPLQPIQAGVLDPLCASTTNQVCLSVLTADSQTTADGSTNKFALANASVLGLGVGAAESSGAIGEAGQCQTGAGEAKTANVTASGGAVAQGANSAAVSQSCTGQAPTVARSSQVIGLGGVQVPLPAAGCADGTPDTVTGIPGVLPIVCNADDAAGAAVVREALDVFALTVGGSSLVKETTAAAEATTTAPAAPETPPQCSDGVDNDGDGLIDIADPGCHTDGNPNNPASFNPNDDSEADSGPGGGSGGENGGTPECSDNRDNDGDGLIDERDPGCHSDGNPNNPDSYNPDDDDERNGGGSGSGAPEADGPRNLNAGSLPFTGVDIVGIALAGLLMLAGGLLMRRREGARAL